MPRSAEGPLRILKRFVRVGDGLVHYRVAGQGPAVVLLHDSPRSSRLHLDTMRALAGRFTVHALDTPGYGNSTPLPEARPSIADFAAALGRALAALGLARAPLYATHTSAKIALEHAAGGDGGPAVLLLDGLSIAEPAASEDFIARYMRPFVIDDAGGYLAAEWTRMRDMLRWFPWFDARVETRMPTEPPSAAWMAAYMLDLLSAGPHYSDAYAAAMRYDPRPALRRVACPTVVGARADDVLFPCLDLVPADRSPSVAVERLAADRDRWIDWLARTLARGAADAPAAAAAADDGRGPIYVDLPHGQMLVHRGGQGRGRPLLILGTPTTLHARLWQDALDRGPATLVPELPGYGESDPLAGGTIADHAAALAAMLDRLVAGPVDVLAIGLAAPIAACLADRAPKRVARLFVDGVATLDAASADRLCPVFVQQGAGGHLQQIWHMLRDGEAQWPWFDGSRAAQRRLTPCLAPAPLHRALLDVLKQPEQYGDGARAALAAGPTTIAHGAPTTLFDRPGDPGYGGVAGLASASPGARIVERPADLAAAATLLAAMLRADPESRI